jgi:hypothetical protein
LEDYFWVVMNTPEVSFDEISSITEQSG